MMTTQVGCKKSEGYLVGEAHTTGVNNEEQRKPESAVKSYPLPTEISLEEARAVEALVKECIPISKTPASEASWGKTPSTKHADDMKGCAGKENIETRKENMIVKFADGVFANRSCKGALSLLFISTPIPYPCCNHSTSKPGIPATPARSRSI